MYYKIRNDVLFRQYNTYGYITDNSEFEYRFSDDQTWVRGEKYVSKSGALMLAALGKSPRHIDDVIEDLMRLFSNVDASTLRHDVVEFFQLFIDKGYLSAGETFDACIDLDLPHTSDNLTNSKTNLNKPCAASTGLFKSEEQLKSIHVEITNACNERCVHCYIPHEAKVDYIDSELFYRILDEGCDLNIINVTLSGGEPLLHPDFLSFLKKTKALDLSINVISNLTLLTDEIEEEMEENPLLSVQTSIYSLNSSVHDSITNLKGSLESTVDNLLRLKSAGIPLQISCPVMKQNKNDVPSVVHWGQEHGIPITIEPAIFASYGPTSDNLAHRLTLEEIEEIIDSQLSEEYVKNMQSNARLKESCTENSPICSVCRYDFCIAPNGTAYPCAGWQTKRLGDLKHQSIRDIWRHSQEVRSLRKITWAQFPQCLNCDDRGYCTVCMMRNANEDQSNDAFKVNSFFCGAAEMLHHKIETYQKAVGD